MEGWAPTSSPARFDLCRSVFIYGFSLHDLGLIRIAPEGAGGEFSLGLGNGKA
jgi:hypothetical protein